MSKFPVASTRRAVAKKAVSGPIEIITPTSLAGPFFSFQYSFTEVSSEGGKTRVTSRQARLANGKLSSETFEGELGRDAYQQMVNQVQKQVLAQMDLLMRSMSWFLNAPRRQSSGRE